MARWNGLEDVELDERVIYVGSYGFDNCDGIGRVYGRTEKQWEAAMRSALAETARTYSNEYESEYQIRGQLWYVGPFCYQVSDVVADLEEPDRASEFRDCLRTSPTGYVP